MEPLLRCCAFRYPQRRRIFIHGKIEGMSTYRVIQLFLAVKVIIDRSNVNAGPPANIPHRCVIKTLLGKHFSGRNQQPLPGFTDTDFMSAHGSTSRALNMINN